MVTYKRKFKETQSGTLLIQSEISHESTQSSKTKLNKTGFIPTL